MESIPFEIANKSGPTQGLVRFETGVLNLEFKAWSWMEFSKKVRTVRVSVRDLEDVEFKRSLLGACVIVRARSLSAVDQIPGTRRGEVRLKFARKHREAARRLGSSLALFISEQRLERLHQQTQWFDS
ncbi:MAG: hypothetical protein ACR2GR_07735 [Rhodothermales bacterium]